MSKYCTKKDHFSGEKQEPKIRILEENYVPTGYPIALKMSYFWPDDPWIENQVVFNETDSGYFDGRLRPEDLCIQLSSGNGYMV